MCFGKTSLQYIYATRRESEANGDLADNDRVDAVFHDITY